MFTHHDLRTVVDWFKHPQCITLKHKKYVCKTYTENNFFTEETFNENLRNMQKELENQKNRLQDWDKKPQFFHARQIINPFELVGKTCFQNRSAMKLCEIDYCLEYALTGQNNDSFLVFADLCGGPGGFAEYLLHRMQWRCIGFGMTLRTGIPYKINKFNCCVPTSNFHIFHRQYGDGDITSSQNIRDFTDWVSNNHYAGCSLVVADGAFEIHPHYNEQEIRTFRLILCQCLTALTILAHRGTFILKMFDCFHPCTQQLIYLMSTSFQQIGFIKPKQSRPANSERYLICHKYKYDTKNSKNGQQFVIDHLHKCNEFLKQKQQFVCRIFDNVNIPIQFQKWLFEHIDKFAQNQISALNGLIGDLTASEKEKSEHNKEAFQHDCSEQAIKLWLHPSIKKQKPFGNRFIKLISESTVPNLFDLCVDHHLVKNIMSETICELYKPYAHFLKAPNNAYKALLYQCQPHCKIRLVNLLIDSRRFVWENDTYRKANCALIGPSGFPADSILSSVKIIDQQSSKTYYKIYDAWCIGGQSIAHFSLTKRQYMCNELINFYLTDRSTFNFWKLRNLRHIKEQLKKTQNFKNKTFLWLLRNCAGRPCMREKILIKAK